MTRLSGPVWKRKGAVFGDGGAGLEEALDALAGLGAQKKHGRVGQEEHVLLNLLVIFALLRLAGVALFAGEVPIC